MPSEAVVKICRLAWEAVEMATGVTNLLIPSSRVLLQEVVRTTFKAEQRLRSLDMKKRRKLERASAIGKALKTLVDVALSML